MSTGSDAIKQAMLEAASGQSPAHGASAGNPTGEPGAVAARPKPRKPASSKANTNRQRKTSQPPGDAAVAEKERKVTVRLPASLHRRIRLEAADKERSMQEVIKDILDARVPRMPGR